MSASLALFAYLHGGDLGLDVIIILCVIFLLGLLLGGVVIAVVLAHILNFFMDRGQRNKAAGDERQERRI